MYIRICISIFSFKKRFVHDDGIIQSFRDLSKLKKMVYSRSFIQRTKYDISRVLYIELTERYKFLSTDFPKHGIVGGLNSECFFFFLKFLYVYKHGNPLDTESALQLLKTSVEEKIYKTTNVLYLARYDSLIEKALELLNDDEGKQSMTFSKALIKSDQLIKLAGKNDEMKMVYNVLIFCIDNIFTRQISDAAN